MDIELKQKFTELKSRVEKVDINPDKLNSELKKIEDELQSPEVWSDQKKASSLGAKVREIKDTLDLYNSWKTLLEDIETALELDDEELLAETSENLQRLEKELDKYDIRKMLSGEYDEADAIISINAGAGGTDAQDWAMMLLRMYTRWAEKGNRKVEILDKSDGEEAGIKSATIKVIGKYSDRKSVV